MFAISGFAIDATTGALTSNGAPVATNFLGRGGAVSPDSRNLYVTAYPVYHFTIDPGTGLLTPRGSSPCCRFHVGLAFTPDQGPVASFTAVAAPELATTFDASASADSDGTVATYLWDFHDGPPVTGGPTISHTFATAGLHTVDLTVSDGMGCSNTRTYTGHMVHCNGTAAARQNKTVVVAPLTPVAVDPPVVVPDPAPVLPAVDTPAPAAAPAIDGLRVSRRCVRSAARAAFDFKLSQDATVRYEVLRRSGSPKWTFCPRLGGTTPITFSSVWQWAAAVGAGQNDTTLAGASARRSPIRLRCARAAATCAHPDRRRPHPHPRHVPAARDRHQRKRPVRGCAGEVLDRRIPALTAICSHQRVKSKPGRSSKNPSTGIDRPLPGAPAASVAPQGVESRKSRDDSSPRGPASSGDESATRGAPLMSNERVIDEIRATLERDPRINHAAQVAVSEQAGQVTLRGTVRSLHQHRVALEIAKSVQGVNAVTDELRVDPRDHALDDQIRGAALQALMSNDEVPDGRIDVRVADGWLTLTGEVKHQRESTVAFETVSNVAGVGGITNKITVITAGMDG